MSNALTFPGAVEFQSKAKQLVETARAIEILDDDGFSEVGQFLSAIKADSKELDRLCDGEIDARYAMHKSAVALKKEYSVPLKEAEDIAKTKMAEYGAKRRAEIAAEKKRLEDEARKVAEAKRKIEMDLIEAENKLRRAKEAEEKKARDIEIAKAKAEGDAKAAKRMETEKLVAAEQVRLRQIEDKKRAEAAAAAPLKIEAVVVQDEAPKAAGVTFAQVWDGKIDGGPDPVALENNLRLLVEAIAAKKAPIYLIQANTTELRKMAESVKGAVKVPGVLFYQKDKVSARS